MKKWFLLTLVLLITTVFSACNESANAPIEKITLTASSVNAPSPTIMPSEDDNVMYFHIGTEVLTVSLSENAATKALKELLAAEDITIDMRDYGGFEKIGDLGTKLPESNVQITTEPGDFIVYQGNIVAIFYAPNSWSYTRLGKINDLTQDELKDILGDADVTVTFSLQPIMTD